MSMSRGTVIRRPRPGASMLTLKVVSWRTGFETHAYFKNVAPVSSLGGIQIYAEAVDSEDNILRQAKAVFVQLNVKTEAVHEFENVEQIEL